jgi:hypothetical protein
LLQCANARVEKFGGIMRRIGSRKLTVTPLLSNGGGFSNEALAITGLKQWDAPVIGKQIVAISQGSMFHALAPYTSWTENTTFNSPAPDFATFRDASAGAPLRLYIAAAGLWKWTGSALTQVVGSVGGDPLPNLVRALGVRLFINDALNPKSLWWSAIGQGDVYTGVGGLSGPGSALVDVLTGDNIIALETLGGALFIGTNESIAKFTGTSDDIQISQDTEGVSTEIGPSNISASPAAWARVEQFIILHSERGVFVATQGGVLGIGDKVEHPNATSLHMSTTIVDPNSGLQLTPVVGHNRRRTEVWFAYAPTGTTRRTNVLVYNYRTQCWYGPFVYPFGITCFGVYEGTDGIEQIMCGCDDAHVRLLDELTAGGLDDGTTDYDAVVEFAPFGIENGPYTTKALDHVFIQVVGDHTFQVRATGYLSRIDIGSFVQ